MKIRKFENEILNLREKLFSEIAFLRSEKRDCKKVVIYFYQKF